MNAKTEIMTATPAEQALPADPMARMIDRIAEIAMNPDLPLKRVEKMMDLQERLLRKEAERAFASAFSKMQAVLPVIPERGSIKNRNGDVQSTYPLWEDVNAALREPLALHGLSMTFDRRREDGKVIMGCIVLHEMGHSRRAEIDLPRDTSGSKNEVQGEGSTVSYGQRYSSKMLINWVSEGTEDDDGALAAGKKTATINEDQFRTLRALIENTNTDEAKFHLAYGHSDPANADLHEFPANRFNEAKTQLERKLAQMGEA